MQRKYSYGQVGLLLLVIMGIVVALVMSIASRSLSDAMLSRQERESSAAFSVAETGIENALNSLRKGVVPGLTTFNDSVGFVTGSYKVDQLTSYTLFVKELDVAQLNVTGYTGNLTILWTRKVGGENKTCTSEGSGNAPAALEMSLFSATTVSRSYYNPFGCNPGPNGFLQSAVDGGVNFRSQITTFSIPAGSTVLRIKPIYSGATISVVGSGVLPTQLYLVKSRAVGGDAQKEIEVKRGLLAPPSIFDYTLFSAGTIVR